MDPNHAHMQFVQTQNNQPGRYPSYGRGQPVNLTNSQVVPQPYFPSAQQVTQQINTGMHQMSQSVNQASNALLQTINPGQPGFIQGQQPYMRTNNATGYLQTNAQPYAPAPMQANLRPQNSGLMQTMINDRSMSDKLIQTIQTTNANVVFRSIHAPPVPIYSGFFVQNESASSNRDITIKSTAKNAATNNNSDSSSPAINNNSSAANDFIDLLGGIPTARPQAEPLAAPTIPLLPAREKAFEPFNPQQLISLVMELKRASQQHALTLKIKIENENTVKQAHEAIWTFPVVQKLINGYVDDMPVSKPYSYSVATLNETQYKVMEERLQFLFKLMSRPVWFSLFEQSFYEIELSKLIQEHMEELERSEDLLRLCLDHLVPFLARDPATTASANLASAGHFDPTATVSPSANASGAGNAEGPLASPHVTAVVRNLVILLGLKLIRLSLVPQAVAPQTNLLDVVALPSPVPHASPATDIHLYLAATLTKFKTLYWASFLLQPTRLSLVQHDWLALFFNTEDPTFLMQEHDYIAVLTQVPWAALVPTLTPDELRDKVLIVLQNLLEKLAKNRYLQAITLIAKIVLFIGQTFASELLLTCIGILSRTPWPTRVIAEPYCLFLNYRAMSLEDLLLIFSEFYLLFGSDLEAYALKPLNERLEHIDQFLTQIMSNQIITQQIYQFDTAVAGILENENFPIFYLFEKIYSAYEAQAAKRVVAIDGSLNLSKLIMEELFQYAFSWGVVKPNPLSLQWAPFLKESAIKAITKISVNNPQVLTQLFHIIGQNLVNVSHQAYNIASFLSNLPKKLWDQWVPDSPSLSILGALLAHKPFLPLTLAADNPRYTQEIQLFFQHFANTKAVTAQDGINFTNLAQIAHVAIPKIKWKNVTHSIAKIRLLMALSLSEIQANTNRKWLTDVLQQDNVNDLVKGPHDFLFAHHFINWHSDFIVTNKDQFRTSARVLTLLQVLVACELVQQNSLNQAQPAQQIMSTNINPNKYTVQWFLKSGYFLLYQGLFVTKQRTVDSHGQRGTGEVDPFDAAALSKLHTLLDTLKVDPSIEITSMFSKLFANQILIHKNFQDVVEKEMINSLSVVQQSFPFWLTLWARTLVPMINEPGFHKIANSLVNGLFFQQINFEDLVEYASRNPLPRAEILKLAATHPWVSFIAIYGFAPRLPPPHRSGNLGEQRQQIENSSLWLWKEVAERVTDNVIALVFWERFFLLVFEVISFYGDQDYFPMEMKRGLNDYFNRVGQSLLQLNLQVAAQTYFSFTTWSKDVIFTSGGSLFATNPDLLQVLFIVSPPTFPGRNQPNESKDDKEDELSDLQSHPFYRNEVADGSAEGLSIGGLIPKPKEVAFEYEEKELALYNAFLKEQELNLIKIQENSNEVPFVADFVVLLSQREELRDAIKGGDERFLLLTRQQYYNHPFMEKITRPFVYQVKTYKIAPMYPGVPQEIKANRQQYNTEYHAFFDCSRSIAHSVSLAVNLKNRLLTIGHPVRPLGISLFFKLLAVVLGELIPPATPIQEILVDIIVALGEAFVQNSRDDYQTQLLYHLLTSSRAKRNPAEDKEIDIKITQDLTQSKHLPTLASSTLTASTMSISHNGPQDLSATRLTATILPSSSAEDHRKKLLTVFQPRLFYESGDVTTYYAMLNSLVSIPTSLSPEEQKILISRFDLKNCLVNLLMENALEIKGLLEILKVSLSLPGYVELSSILVTYIVAFEFPTNVDFVLRLIFVQTKSVYLDYETIFGTWSRFSHDKVLLLSNTLHSLLSSPTLNLSQAMVFFKHLVLDTSMKAQLIQENENAYYVKYEDQIFLPESTTWNSVEMFIKKIFSLSVDQEQLNVNSLQVESCFQLLFSVVNACPRLIDRFWSVYVDVIIPIFSSSASLADSQKTQTFLIQQLRDLPWKLATFHYSDTNSLSHLCNQVTTYPFLISMIFSQLDWPEFAIKINTVFSLDQNYTGKNVALFLRLFISLNIVSPMEIPTNIREMVCGIITNDGWFEDGQFLVDWRTIKPNVLSTVFSGNTLYGLFISAGSFIVIDPSERVLESLNLLRTITSLLCDVYSLAAVATECAQFLFTSITHPHTHLHWYLPFQDQIKLLVNVLIPLVSHHLALVQAHKTQHRITYPDEIVQRPLVTLLRCACCKQDSGQDGLAVYKFWEAKILPLACATSSFLPVPVNPSLFSTKSTATQPNKINTDPRAVHPYQVSATNNASILSRANSADTLASFQAFNEKVYGIVLRFASSSNSLISYFCLKYTEAALGLCPNIMMEILAGTLNNLLVQTKSTKVSGVARCARILQLGPLANLKMSELVRRYVQPLELTLVFRALLEKKKYTWNWDDALFVSDVIQSIVSFQPSPTRPFDLIALWFFILELADDRRWNDKEGFELTHFNVFIQQLTFDNSFVKKMMGGSFYDITGSVHLTLAAKVVHLFLLEILSQRRALLNKKGFPTKQLMDELLHLKDDKKYAQFANLFDEITRLLSKPTWTLSQIQGIIVRYIFPFAPYLMKMFVLTDKADLLWCHENGITGEEDDDIIDFITSLDPPYTANAEAEKKI